MKASYLLTIEISISLVYTVNSGKLLYERAEIFCGIVVLYLGVCFMYLITVAVKMVNIYV